MSTKGDASIQRSYYERTAGTYDALHLKPGAEHEIACRFISALLPLIEARSVLDIGCGTGRAVEFLRQRHPALTIDGIEPVEALLEVARQKLGPDGLVCGDGRGLPYRDQAYDVVIETGILHHVKRPELVVKEMERVASRAIFISDHNIFGQGTMPARITKWALYKCGLWTLAKLILTKGKGYHISEGDGLAYSYSVYFQYPMIRAWAARTFVIPLRSAGQSDVPLRAPWFSADEVLLCALKTEIS